jgi:hypothetical protein
MRVDEFHEEEAISEIGSMMRRQRPAEIEVTAKTASLYDCSVIVKAIRSVLKVCTDLLQRKVPVCNGRTQSTMKASWELSWSYYRQLTSSLLQKNWTLV